MSNIKIKETNLVESIVSNMKLPVGNTGDDSQPLSVSVEQIKDFSLSGLSSVATSGSFSDLLNKPDIPTKTRTLLITYDDETTEKIDVYTT